MRKEKGFTIIEIIIAIFVLSTAVIGVYSAFSIMDVLSDDATDRLTATYLAQEGVEIVRNIRDNNWLQCVNTACPWNSFLADINCSSGCEYEVDFQSYPNESNILPPFVGDPTLGEGTPLNISPEGYYGYSISDSAVPTKFRRRVTITYLNDKAIKVSVEVFWKAKANIIRTILDPAPSIKVEEILYNWYAGNEE